MAVATVNVIRGHSVVKSMSILVMDCTTVVTMDDRATVMVTMASNAKTVATLEISTKAKHQYDLQINFNSTYPSWCA